MQLFKAKQQAQREVETALKDVGMTMDEVRAYLEAPRAQQRVPQERRTWWAAPPPTSCTRSARAEQADLPEEQRARRPRSTTSDQDAKNSVVSVAPEVVVEEGGRPAVPAGRKTLTVVN
jgi:DNA-binding transcriptional MerR regulator